MKKYGWISLMLCVLLLLGGCGHACAQFGVLNELAYVADKRRRFDVGIGNHQRASRLNI